MKDNLIPEYVCVCGYEQDRSSDSRGEETPSGGDVSVCLNCARITIFNDDLTQRTPTNEDIADLKKDKATFEWLMRVRDTIIKNRHLMHADTGTSSQ